MAPIRTRLTPDDFDNQPQFIEGDIAAKNYVWSRVRQIVMALFKEPERIEKANRTTFAVAVLETPDGSREVWISSAGVGGSVPRYLRKTGDRAINNLHPDAAPGNHLNDAEAKIIREAVARGCSIKALGASRHMCPICQASSVKAGILNAVVTPLEKLSE